MKITQRQLKQIIREEKQKLSLPRAGQDFGSNAARQEALNEQTAMDQIPKVEIVDEGGTLTMSADDATAVEAVIAQAFDVVDELTLSIESGGYPQSTRQTVIDPRLEQLKNSLEEAVEGLYNAQMQANHLIAGTGS